MRAPSPHEAEAIVIARRMFIGGCFLLPWLWIANLLYFRHALVDSETHPELRQCACPAPPSARPPVFGRIGEREVVGFVRPAPLGPVVLRRAQGCGGRSSAPS